MAKETTNQGYIDAQSYATDPDNVETPDSTRQEYEVGIKSYSLSQDGETAAITALITADTVNSFVGINEAVPLGTMHVKTSESGAVTPNVTADDLVIENATHCGMNILSGAGSQGNIYFGDSGNSAMGQIQYDHASNKMLFAANNTLSLVIDASQNLGVGETLPLGKIHSKTGDSDAAVSSSANQLVAEGSATAGISILSGAASTGNILFADSGSTAIGKIDYNHSTNAMSLSTNGNTAMLINSSGHIAPGADNTRTNGTASLRWSEIFAGNATINTSDAREKTVVAVETLVLDAIDSLSITGFKWNDAIASKGEANARIHYGVIAQEVKAAFEAQGLAAEAYGVLCYDEWEAEYDTVVDVEGVPEVLDEAGNVVESAVPPVYKQGDLTKEAGNRYGVRYEELYALKIAALERKIALL